MSDASPPYDLEAFLARHVPITRAMGLRLGEYGPGGIVLTAPLAPNVNDKGIAFGGSIASLMSLAGWALTDFILREDGVEGAEVVIARTSIEFLRPVVGPIEARCARPSAAEVSRLLAAWRSRARARWDLECTVEGEGGRGALAHARYVVRPRAIALAETERPSRAGRMQGRRLR